jgi:pimeloyl-ACP methyl ester carboxylesterase
LNFVKRAFVWLCNLILLAKCSNSKDAEYSSSSFFRQNQSKQNEGLVVFIHGIFGDAKNTWTSEQTKAYFPALISGDSTFNNFDIFVYGFTSPKFESALNIDELGEDLRSTFEDQGFARYSQITFVCHSMGGLVARSFLIKYREQWADKTKLIYYYATPSNGSQIANWARLFSRNIQLENLQLENGDLNLADQYRAWLAAPSLRDIPAFCAYEKKETSTAKVVEFTSASAMCNRELDPIEADHIQIVKPRDTNSKSFIVLRNAFRKTFKENSLSNIPQQKDSFDHLGKSPESHQSEIDKKEILRQLQDIKSNLGAQQDLSTFKNTSYPLRDINDRPLNVGDFYEYVTIVNGNVPERERNFFLIGKINKNDDCIFTYDTDEKQPGMAISTFVLVSQQMKTVVRRKLEPQWIKDHYPEQYNILTRKAMLGGLIRDNE